MQTNLARTLLATSLTLALPWSAGAQAGGLCSTAPCAYKDISVSKAARPDVQIAADPVDPNRLLIGTRASSNACPSTATHASTDSGRTWRSTCLEIPFGFTSTSSPAVGFSGQGEMLALSGESSGAAGWLLVNEWNDAGFWSRHATYAFPERYPQELSLRLDTGAASPYRRRVYGPMILLGASDSEVYVTYSNRNGKWSLSSASPGYDSEHEIARSPDLAVGRSGTAYLSYSLCRHTGDPDCTSTPVNVLLVSSTDGGATWSEPRPIQQVVRGPSLQNWRVPNKPSVSSSVTGNTVSSRAVLAVDASAGPHSGRLYSVVSSQTDGRLQILLSRSDDGGASWSAPAAVSPVAGVHDQFQPSVRVSARGEVAVGWLDRRNDPNNVKYQPMVAVSTDGGASFGAPLVLDQDLTDPSIVVDQDHAEATFAATVWSGNILSTAFFGVDGVGGVNEGQRTLRFNVARP